MYNLVFVLLSILASIYCFIYLTTFNIIYLKTVIQALFICTVQTSRCYNCGYKSSLHLWQFPKKETDTVYQLDCNCFTTSILHHSLWSTRTCFLHCHCGLVCLEQQQQNLPTLPNWSGPVTGRLRSAQTQRQVTVHRWSRSGGQSTGDICSRTWPYLSQLSDCSWCHLALCWTTKTEQKHQL